MKVYKEFKFEPDDEAGLPYVQLETIQCPKCDFRFPVLPEYIDYQELYERALRYSNEIEELFLEFVDDAEKKFDVPLSEFLDEYRLGNLIEKLKQRYREYGGE